MNFVKILLREEERNNFDGEFCDFLLINKTYRKLMINENEKKLIFFFYFNKLIINERNIQS